jgi:hypothetical protein
LEKWFSHEKWFSNKGLAKLIETSILYRRQKCRPLDQALWQADFIFVPRRSILRSDKRWRG